MRPYAVTKGRTAPASGSWVGLIDVVAAVADPQLPADPRLNREHRRVLSHCRQPVAVVDLASEIDLPVGVIRVLLSDLSELGALRVITAHTGPVTREHLLRNVLNALQAL